VRVHRRRSGELHADVGPGQEERARVGRVQVHGHAHLHLQTGAGKRRFFVIHFRNFLRNWITNVIYLYIGLYIV